MSRHRLVLAGLGCLLLAWLVRQYGLDRVLTDFGTLGWSFPLLLTPSAVWHLTNAAAWGFAFAPGERPGFSVLFTARLAGDTVNQLTPLAGLGGEPVKAYLVRHCAPGPAGPASVVVARTGQFIVGFVFTVTGLGLLLVAPPAGIRLPASWVAGLVVLLAAAGLGLWLLVRGRDRLFASFLALARRLGLPHRVQARADGWAAQVDASIGLFCRQHPSRVGGVLLLEALGWLAGYGETFLILRQLGAGLSFATCFLIAALGTVLHTLFFFVPGGIGVMEGGQVLIFDALGLDPALGLSMGLVKRLRKFVWIAVGWGCLTRLGGRAPVARRTADRIAEVDPVGGVVPVGGVEGA